MIALPEDDAPVRPLWLTTLADLALLLVGFFVFLQASRVDPGMLAAGFRAGFGAPQAAMPVDLATVAGFATGSARLPDTRAAIAWARTATTDPRTLLRITGEVDGSPGDVDRATGSGPILAADRARAVAEILVRARAVAPERIVLATGRGSRRAVLTLGYEGHRPSRSSP